MTGKNRNYLRINDGKPSPAHVSRNTKNLEMVTIAGTSLNQRVTDHGTDNVLPEGTQEDIEGINAFNTEDVLKQEVNPTHAINPAMFKGQTDANQMDLNSSRYLVDRKPF